MKGRMLMVQRHRHVMAARAHRPKLLLLVLLPKGQNPLKFYPQADVDHLPWPDVISPHLLYRRTWSTSNPNTNQKEIETGIAQPPPLSSGLDQKTTELVSHFVHTIPRIYLHHPTIEGKVRRNALILGLICPRRVDRQNHHRRVHCVIRPRHVTSTLTSRLRRRHQHQCQRPYLYLCRLRTDSKRRLLLYHLLPNHRDWPQRPLRPTKPLPPPSITTNVYSV